MDFSDAKFITLEYTRMIIEKYDAEKSYRFISKTEVAFKIHIHLPDDTTATHSIGFIKTNEQDGFHRAVKKRDEVGREHWGKHWNQVLNDEHLFMQLPHSLEPKLIYKPRKDSFDECYLGVFPAQVDGKRKMKSIVRSTKKRGKSNAYKEVKKAILNGYKDVIDIMLFMGRITERDLYIELDERNIIYAEGY